MVKCRLPMAAAALARAALLGLAFVAAAAAARAASIVGVSPEGAVASVSQAVVRFDRAVVPLGDLRAPDPMTLACSGGGSSAFTAAPSSGDVGSARR